MAFYLKKHFIFLLALTFVMVGCSKDDVIENPNANNTSLSGFSFKKGNNDNMNSNATSSTNGSVIYITVPEDVDTKSLVPSFTIAEGASATINGKPVESDITECDFSNTSKITVTSESGTSRTYTILVRNGNPKIDNMVYSFMITHAIPGISVAISKDEEIVYKAGYGFAVVDKEIRVTPETLFRLASMSKQQTALGIMTLYEKGLLGIDDKVFGKGGILEKEFGTNVLASVESITVRHLLNHTAGWDSDPIYTSATTTLDQRIENYVTSVNPAYTPGTTFDYSNLGFCILGKIIEVISGKDYETFLKEEVHAKAGVKNIFVGKNSLGERRENECQYYGQDGKNAYGNDVELSKAAGGMIASAEELMTLMSYIDYGTKVPDMFKKETLDMMYAPMEDVVYYSTKKPYKKYAMGWRTMYTDFPEWEAFHGGTLAGVATIWARNISGVNGVILCNSRSYDQSIDDEMWYMLRDIQEMF